MKERKREEIGKQVVRKGWKWDVDYEKGHKESMRYTLVAFLSTSQTVHSMEQTQTTHMKVKSRGTKQELKPTGFLR